MTRLVIPGLVALILTGCNQSASAPPASKTAAIKPAGETVINRDYANWSRFPVGTTIIRRSVTARGSAETISTETFTLKQSVDSCVVVERQNTTERNDGSYKAVHPPETRTYQKSFTAPQGMTAEDFAKPSLKAKQSGEEEIEMAGKKYKAVLFKWVEHSEVGNMNVTVWMSDEIPGRIVKQTIVIPSTETTTTETVTSIVLGDTSAVTNQK